jgi:hypothetical protein
MERDLGDNESLEVIVLGHVWRICLYRCLPTF